MNVGQLQLKIVTNIHISSPTSLPPSILTNHNYSFYVLYANRKSLKFYDEYEWLIGSSNIYQFTVYDSPSTAPPSVDVHSPIVHQDENYYLVAMCKQFQSFPVQKLQFWKNGEPVGEMTKDKELPLYLTAHSGNESKGHFRSSKVINGHVT